MAFPDDIFLNEDRCEICGIELEDEIVIQEFADGSLARLCPECAAGAALEALETYEPSPDDTAEQAPAEEPRWEPVWQPEPDSAGTGQAEAAALAAEPAAPDRLEKTRELLTPVVDLITLQREMQDALQRLASSLEVFATGVITENLDKAATVESRLESLEKELERTRARLRETEALLAAATAAGAAGGSAAPAATAPVIPEFAVPAVVATVPEFVTPEPPPSLLPVDTETTQETADLPDWVDEAQHLEDTKETAEADALVAHGGEEIDAGQAAAAALAAAAAAAGAPPIPVPVAPPASAPVPPPQPQQAAHEYHAFELGEVQIAQRYYNDSAFTGRIRDVRRSLGKPKANLTKLPGAAPRALLTIAWDIIWYQYLIDLRRDVPSDTRIVLYKEGLDLDELAGIFKEKNASIDDEGRLDASELEVKLLSDPTVLITEMTPDEERALEDATEEIWDQHTAPEFKWDD
jgi:hypothetical protein